MKQKNTLTIIVGILLLILFAFMIFTFQVRSTEVAVVTTFDNPKDPVLDPGLHFKWPAPIQKVYKFDKRIQNFEDKFEETITRDGYLLMVQTYVGWSVADPRRFFSSIHNGRAADAEPLLEGMIRTAKNGVIGTNLFSGLVSADPANLQFEQIEKEIFNQVHGAAWTNYGIDVKFVGISKLGLPQSVTETVFKRMTAERNRKTDQINGEADRETSVIKSDAERDRKRILAAATREASEITGLADLQAATTLTVLNQEPELALALLKIEAFNEALKTPTTYFLDGRSSPFDILGSMVKTNGTAPVMAPVQNLK